MNEIKMKQIQKQYEEYHSFYNKVVRPVDEKRPVKEVQGLVSWKETNVHTQVLTVVGRK
jgi:hypothetical protein